MHVAIKRCICTLYTASNMTQPNVKFSDVTVVELQNRTKTRLRNDESRYQTTSKMSQSQKLNCPVGIESVEDLIFVSQIK